MNKRDILSDCEEVDDINKELEYIYEKRRQQFAKRYREAFHKECEFKQLITDDEKMQSGDYILTLNYYGIKSNWL